MVDGVSQSGQSALKLVEEERRIGPELAPTLYQLTVEMTVREKALKLRTAILRTVQVTLNNTCLTIIMKQNDSNL